MSDSEPLLCDDNSPPSSADEGDTRRARHYRSIVQCTPEIAFGSPMAQYVRTQTLSSKKQWIYEILDGTREGESVILDTPSFALIPDIDANTEHTANWLAVFKDRSLRSLRDLNGSHVQMLRTARDRCTNKIVEHTRLPREQVMCYFHYLPSVFQLHMHVCAPYGHYTTPDIFKIHPVDNVISNLLIDTDFYRKATITTVVVGRGDLHSVYRRSDRAWR
jgi:m7GpppX diphosphatase